MSRRLTRGPFTLKWGDNEIDDVEEVKVDYKRDSDDIQTVQGKTFEVDGPLKVTATITLLKTDIAALALLLPQYFVPNGQRLSTGETVNYAAGAIDVKPHACDTDLIYNHFDIISCGNPGQVTRIVNARTVFESFDVDNKLEKVMVKIIGESEADEGVVQFFANNTVHVVS